MTSVDRRLRELEARLRDLEQVNETLTEANERYLLLGLVAEAIASHDDVGHIVTAGLEQTSVLEDLPVCACCELRDGVTRVRQSHVSFAHGALAPDAITLSDRVQQRMVEAPRRPTIAAIGDDVIIHTPSPAPPLTSAIVFPFSTRSIDHGAFVFASAGAPPRVEPITPVLARIVDMLVARMDNAALLIELAQLNAHLDRKLARLTDGAHDFVWRTDADGIITFANAAAERVLGVPVPALLGTRLFDHMSPLSAERARQAARVAHAATPPQRHYRVEVDYRNRDGRMTTCEVNVTLVLGESNRIVALEGIARDLTARREAEASARQAQKMEALGTLAGGIAHDFNNLLTPIMSGVDLALRSLPRASRVSEYLLQARTASLRAADLVQQILHFGRASIARRDPLDLAASIDEAVRFLRSALPATIEIVTRLPEEDVTVRADPTEILQVLMNLCTNAGHVMPDGGTLRIDLTHEILSSPLRAAHADLPAGRYARVCVADTGPGIAADAIDRIFDPYFTLKAPGEGTGLGLAVVRGIVHSLGGGVTVASEPGHGAQFSVYVPLAPGSADTTAPTTAQACSGTETVLFVDDEDGIRAVVGSALEMLGYEVTTCASGAEALDHLRASPAGHAILVTDLTMPSMTGAELIERARQIAPDLPVVLCTGRPDPALRHLHAQPNAALCTKPFSPEELGRVMRRVIDARPSPAHDE